ncbi:hypothetical protein PIB30_087018, partial [Stylosanthes scabra]|nr:hypothetical protein [Stylosanthes scabra]
LHPRNTPYGNFYLNPSIFTLRHADSPFVIRRGIRPRGISKRSSRSDFARFNRLRSERKWLKRARGTRKSRRKAWMPNSDSYAYAPRLMCVRIAKTWAARPSWNRTPCVRSKTPYAYAPEAKFEAYK